MLAFNDLTKQGFDISSIKLPYFLSNRTREKLSHRHISRTNHKTNRILFYRIKGH